jgi:hypothetical protein
MSLGAANEPTIRKRAKFAPLHPVQYTDAATDADAGKDGRTGFRICLFQESPGDGRKTIDPGHIPLPAVPEAGVLRSGYEPSESIAFEVANDEPSRKSRPRYGCILWRR